VESTKPDSSSPLASSSRLEVPGVWEQVSAALPALSYEIVRQIRAEIPDYAVVPLAEHRKFVLEQARILIDGLARQAPPEAEQVAAARELGQRRARQGLPIEMMLGAYQITYREAWNAALQQATANSPSQAGHLAQMVNLMWTWVRVMTSSAADSYSAEFGRGQVTRANRVQHFLAALTGEPPQAEPIATLAQALGYQPEADFQALALPAEDWTGDQVGRLQRRLADLPGRQDCAAIGQVVVVLGQHHDIDGLTASIRKLHDDAGRVGIGLLRSGLDGASASIKDATDALAISTRRHPAVTFADCWLVASLHSRKSRLSPLFAQAVTTAHSDAHLAAAVVAFAGNGLSVAAAARALRLHPNSLAYRLSRWHELTGLDPRSGEGLVASLVALRLYPGEDAAQPSDDHRTSP
jgi:hypothetical protein